MDAGGRAVLSSAEASPGVLRSRPRLSIAAGLLPAGVVLAVVYAIPTLRLVAQSFIVDGHASLALYQQVLALPEFWIILWRTLQTGVLVTALCLIVGYPYTYVVNRVPGRHARWLLLIATIPFFTSLLIWAYSWVVILGTNGLVNHFLMALGIIQNPLRLVYNDPAVIIGMVQIQLPLMVLPLFAVMRRIDRSLVLAAQSLGATPFEAFWDVFLPLSMPGVAAGTCLVFVTSLGFFITPALLGGPGEYLIAQSIQSYVQVRANFGIASTEATILLVLVGGLMLVFRGPMGASFRTEDDDLRWPHRGRRPAALDRTFGAMWRRVRSTSVAVNTTQHLATLVSMVRRPVLTVHTGLVVLYLLLPMAIIIPLAFSSAPFLVFPPPGFSLRWFHSYFSNAEWIHSTWFSLGISLASASLASVLGILAAFPIVRGTLRAASLLYLLYLSPLIIPQMVPAVAIFFAAAPAGLVGTPLAFIAVYTVIGLPYIIVVVTTALRRFDRSLERAASSMGASPLRVLLTVTLPLISPAILSGFLFAFLTAWGELVFALFLSGPDATPLPIQMWSDIRMEISPRIAAVSVLSFAIALLAAFVPTLIVRRRPGIRAGAAATRSVVSEVPRCAIFAAAPPNPAPRSPRVNHESSRRTEALHRGHIWNMNPIGIRTHDRQRGGCSQQVRRPRD